MTDPLDRDTEPPACRYCHGVRLVGWSGAGPILCPECSDEDAFSAVTQAWREQRSRVVELEREMREVTSERDRLQLEIESWKDASGLTCGGDPDGVTPAAMRRYWEGVEAERDRLRAERDRLRAYIDEAGDGANLVALLDLYHERAETAEVALVDARANIDLLEAERAELLREARARRHKPTLRCEACGHTWSGDSVADAPAVCAECMDRDGTESRMR